MPDRERVESFMRTVEAAEYVKAIEDYYTPEASMRENQAKPRAGRDGLVKHERMVLGAHKAIRCARVGAPIVDGDRVAIKWAFEFEFADGSVKRLEEVAWQRWEGDRIAEEQFVYDPGQMA